MAKQGYRSMTVTDEVGEALAQVVEAHSTKHGIKPPLSGSQMLLIVLKYYEDNAITTEVTKGDHHESTKAQ